MLLKPNVALFLSEAVAAPARNARRMGGSSASPAQASTNDALASSGAPPDDAL